MTNFLHNFNSVYYIFIVAFSAIVAYSGIPSILHVARLRHLYDDLGHFRKTHDHGIPRLGGVAIFAAFIITSLLFCVVDDSLPINYMVTAAMILFVMGLKDDLVGVNSSTKLMIQFIAGGILVLFGNIRLSSLYGLLGIYNLSYFPSVGLSILIIILIVNAFNLIDGIDGLAALTGIVTNGFLAAFYISVHQHELAAVSLAMVGAILGFLKFNISPAKIFMGDTGSLLIGLVSAIMALKFMQVCAAPSIQKLSGVSCAPALTFAVLIGPVFDTLRVFVVRLKNGASPFEADRNHIHHRMLTLGLSHLHTTMILTGVNIAGVAAVFLLRNYGNAVLISLTICGAIVFNLAISFSLRSKERKRLVLQNLSV